MLNIRSVEACINTISSNYQNLQVLFSAMKDYLEELEKATEDEKDIQRTPSQFMKLWGKIITGVTACAVYVYSSSWYQQP